MSCAMYQPYAPYFPYHQRQDYHRPQKELVGKEESEKGGEGRAQYLSANCVLLTYCSGDAAALVDEHFARALGATPATPHDKPKGSSSEGPPMSHRNFPASFWNSNYPPPPPATEPSLYAGEAYGAPLYGPQEACWSPWPPYSHHQTRYHQYGPLLLQRPPRLPPSAACAASADAPSWPPTTDPYAYPTPPGLEGQPQDSKDLYWF